MSLLARMRGSDGRADNNNPCLLIILSSPLAVQSRMHAMAYNFVAAVFVVAFLHVGKKVVYGENGKT